MFGLGRHGAITWGRFYMELVEQGGADIDETMRQTAKVSA